MPKFSEQRIIQSKKVFCQYVWNLKLEHDINVNKIFDNADMKTILLYGNKEGNEYYSDAYESNLKVELNNSIRMAIPRIRNRYQSGFAMFYADESIKKEDVYAPSLLIFSRKEFINYVINKHLELISIGKYRSPVIRFYERIGFKGVERITGLSSTAIVDEIEYAKSKIAARYRKETTFLLHALINCGQISNVIDHMIDENIESVFDSITNGYCDLSDSAKYDFNLVLYDDKEYFCVPYDEDDEIKNTGEDYSFIVSDKR